MKYSAIRAIMPAKSSYSFGVLLIGSAALAACAPTPPIDLAPLPWAAQPRFDALAFFAGRSEGRGRLKQVFSRTVPVHVESEGRMERGVLHLVQTVHEGEKPAREREWVIREVAPGRYAGTLSDAQGEVAGESEGNRLHLSFTMKGGFPVEQWLTLSPDGRRAYNLMRVRKLGLTLATLAEDIRKAD